jgi:putative membrane protein
MNAPVRLTEADKQSIRERAAAIESRTGIEVIAVLTARSDSYPEIPWKAFAFVAAAVMAVLALLEIAQPAWPAGGTALRAAAISLGAGLFSAVLTLFVPAYARLWLDGGRAETEVRQYGQALFLERELHATPQRLALLLLVSGFERRVLVLPDRGLRARIDATAWQAVVTRMAPLLHAGRLSEAMLAGLDAAERQLVSAGVHGGGGDAIADELITPEAP